MSGRNIGEHLGEDGGFECAFWTTYSIDFSTAYFIINQHIRPLIQDQPCHIMMDLRKAHEACQADNHLKALGKLQSKAVISTCDKRVAFHPKLLLLAGDSKIRLIVTSGNATALGVLSDADLIARFDYDKEAGAQTEVRGIIAEGFRFLKSCRGWHPNALDVIEKVQTRHPWLAGSQSESFLGTHRGIPMFEQALQSLGNAQVKKIEIYSPFYDPTLNALRRFRESFPKVPIEAWAGAGFVELDESFDIDHLVKLGVTLHRPLFKGRDSFHAKVYRFMLDRHSVVFWGSANCSNSALLSTKNSSEVLVKTIMSDDEFRGLFDPLPSKPIGKAQVRPLSGKDDDVDALPLKITSATIEEGRLSFMVSGHASFRVRVLGASGPDMASNIFSAAHAESNTFTVDISQARFKILAIELVDSLYVAVSNRFPLSNLDYIYSAEDADAPAIRRRVEEGLPEAITQIERQFFTFEKSGIGAAGEKGASSSAERNFWKARRSSHSVVWGAGYPSLSYAAQARLAETEPETDRDEEPTPKLRKGADKPMKEKPVIQGWPWTPNVGTVIKRNHRRLLKFLKEGVRPNEDQWATGLEHFTRYLIKPLVEAKADLGEDMVYDFADILLLVAQMAAYFTNNKNLPAEEIKGESVIARLASFAKVIDFSYFFSTVDIEIYREFHSTSELQDNHPESLQRQASAGFLKTWVYTKFPTLSHIFREQNLTDMAEAQRCFRQAKACAKALRHTEQYEGVIQPLANCKPEVGACFTHNIFGPLLIEQWLGEKVECISLLGEPKILSTIIFPRR